ncbi:phage tailspike protein [Sodalis sp. RH16]|uniref:phage tailspike protein n=1 Tax=Sodalis sp. RH16 TaxID=3394331 RepID=UPI0039B381EE
MAIPNVVVSAPSQLFTLPNSFAAVAGGSIYIGQINTDPTVAANQIQVYVQNNDGSTTAVSQPISIGAGGYPEYNGSVSKFVTVEGQSMAVLDANGVQQFYYPDVLKYDPDQLSVSLAEQNGAQLVGFRYSTVYSSLNHMLTSTDYGGAYPFVYGQSSVDDANIIAEQTGDQDLLHYGGIYIGKNGFGIGRNNCVISARLNASNLSFFPQVAGASTTQALANYGSVDGVASFSDASSTPYNSWEIFSSPVYSATGFTATSIDTANVKVGMVVLTNHSTPWWGIISSVTSTTITLADGWWQASSSVASTPTSGIGLYLNPLTKIWAHNANVTIGATTRTSNAVIAEYGLINNKVSSPTNINGIDVVLLSQSTYGGTAGVYVHPAGTQNWLYGFDSVSAKNANFFSSGSASGTFWNGFQDASSSQVGLRFGGQNIVASINWCNNVGTTDLTEVNTNARIDGAGRVRKLPKFLTNISADISLNSLQPSLVVLVSGIAITIPKKTNVQAGHQIELFNISSGAITLLSTDSTINNASSYSLAVAAYTKYTLLYGGAAWYVFQG